MTEQLTKKLVLQEESVEEQQEKGLLGTNLMQSVVLQQNQIQQKQNKEVVKLTDLIEDKTMVPHEVELGGANSQTDGAK